LGLCCRKIADGVAPKIAKNQAITLKSKCFIVKPPAYTLPGFMTPAISITHNGVGSIAASQFPWKGQFHAHNHNFEKYATNSPAANAIGGVKTTISHNRTIQNTTINSM